jgi:hypothetical protein
VPLKNQTCVLCVVYLGLLSNSDLEKLKGKLVKVNSQQYENFVDSFKMQSLILSVITEEAGI